MGKDFEEVRQLSSNIEAWRYPEGGQLYFVGRQEVALDHWVKMTEGRLEHQLRNSPFFSFPLLFLSQTSLKCSQIALGR